jgi:hypothetical protein
MEMLLHKRFFLSFPESKKKMLLWVYLDPKILLPEIAKGHADGMIYHVRDALQDNLGNGFHPLKGTPSTHSLVAIGLLHLSCSQRKNQQVMHSSHSWKLELVVQHVSDSGCGGIVHHNAAINRSTRSVAVYRLHVSGFEEGRNRRGSSTDFPEIEIPGLILQGIGSGEEKRTCSGKVVARDEHGLDSITKSQRSSISYQVLFQQAFQLLARESGTDKTPDS